MCRGLRDNVFIATQWMKILHLIISRRTATLKEYDELKKTLSQMKRINRNKFSSTVYHILKEQGWKNDVENHVVCEQRPPSALIYDYHYWKLHDCNANDIICRIWVQRSIRAHVLALESVRSRLRHINANVPTRSEAEEDILMVCLRDLLALTRHEYDGVRPQARKYFEKSTAFLGYKVTIFIEDLLQVVQQQTATYYHLASTLIILKQGRIMKRIASDIHLKKIFLTSFFEIQKIASTNVEEMDKREKVLLSLADCFVKYTSLWHHRDHGQEIQVLQSEVNAYVLQHFGISTSPSNDETAMDVASPTTSSNTSLQSVGLRFDAFLSYTMLHTVGSGLLSHPNQFKAMLDFSLIQLGTAYGQPTQMIAFALFIRLVEIVHVNSQLSPSPVVEFGECQQYLKQIFQDYFTSSTGGSGSGNTSWKSWTPLFTGLSKCHPKANLDEHGNSQQAQWSKGIDQVISAAVFLRIVKPRLLTSKRYEHNICSAFVRKEMACLFYTLAKLGLVVDLTSSQAVSQLQVVFNSLKDIAASNEAEQRTRSAVRAEIVAGILRAFFSTKYSAEQLPLKNEIEQCLTKYILDVIEPLSMDYCRDWQEAFSFAYEEHFVHSEAELGPLANQLISAFQQSLKVATSNISDVDEESNPSNDEGFSRHGKNFMLVAGLIHGDSMSKLFCSGTTSSAEMFIAKRVSAILTSKECQLIISYRSLRAELSSVFNALLDYAGDFVNFDQDILRKLTPYIGVKSSVEVKEETAAVEIAMGVDGEVPSPESVEVQVKTSIKLDAKQKQRQHAIELAILIAKNILHYLPIRSIYSKLTGLLPILLDGVNHPDLETAKSATSTVKYVMNVLLPTYSFVQSNGLYYDASVIEHLQKMMQQQSDNWRMKELIVKVLAHFMIQNWFVLSADEKKWLKDIFTGGINDAHVNVQEASKEGMIGYLTYKTAAEMKAIADVYTRNSEALATREKQKKKQQKAGTTTTTILSTKPDNQYWNIMQMISCVLLSTPYDLPAFTPALLSSFLRHGHYYDVNKQLIMKTMQSFKRTHQDRWEEFKKYFTSEQLDDLQGAGAAHYFA